MKAINQIIKTVPGKTDQKSKEKISNSEQVELNVAKHYFMKVVEEHKPYFVIDKQNRTVIATLLMYAINHQGFEKTPSKYCYSLQKGILLAGNIGVGKSDIMYLLQHCRFPGKSFWMKSCREIARQFGKEGWSAIEKYCSSAIEFKNQEKQLKHMLFDDLGSESSIHLYGNRVNVMAEIILDRYDLFKKHGLLTHFTTNLDSEEIKEVYGDWIHSRIHEMCNFVLLGSTEEAVDRRIDNAKSTIHEH